MEAENYKHPFVRKFRVNFRGTLTEFKSLSAAQSYALSLDGSSTIEAMDYWFSKWQKVYDIVEVSL